jgi:uncharacterized caspase-like protein
MLFLALPGIVSSASAQQQEKRIALVVGDGAYEKSPLATAANDAGLIAQTLQAAGFDVVGARDLDADTLRGSFRDFIQKAQASGPGTVAMVYLSGYGMQLAGENYFIPVDSKLGRDVDIPIEGLRISDYTRQLASLPLKASIVVLDAARQQPFIEGGQPIAGGLALVEPDPHMLIAFNAAPGTVAPNEQGNYGVYAQSLAEMIRTGGLPLPEVFNRLRLRVNDASKGAQVPWDAEKIDAPFMFFDRAPDAPAQAPPDQVAAIRNKPIRDLGVQDAYAAALERDTMPGYEDFLAAYPGDPLARRVRAIVAARREAITWSRTYRTDTPQAYWSYLRRYPRGPHAWDARRRLAILTAPLEPPPSFAVVDYDVLPPPPDEIIYVDRPVLMFSNPEFDFLPPPPPPIFFLPPPPPDFVILAPPIVAVGLFILPQPFFVPIPDYVQSPVYVAPPANNIIFANIHNTTVINNVINQPPAPVAPAAAAGAPAAPVGATAGVPATPVTPTTQPGGVSTAATKSGAAQGAVTTTTTGAQVQTPLTVKNKTAAILSGNAPAPPSTVINGTAKSAGIANVQSGQKGTTSNAVQTNATSSTLPADKTLPGMKGGTTLPKGPNGSTPAVTNLNAKPGLENKLSTTTPTTTPPTGPATGAGAAGSPKTLGTTGPAQGGMTPGLKPTPENKSATVTPATQSPTAPATGAGAAGSPKTLGTTGPAQGATTPSGKPAPETKSATTTPTTSPAGAASGAGAGPKVLDKRKDVVLPPPPPSAKPAAPAPKPTPPVAHVEPAHRAAPPPPPPPRVAPQIARPAPPPPPRPAPQIARPAPPPPPRPAPPPPPPPHPVAQAVRPAPPPPPRPAPPPPARPAPAAAKKCPPNVPKC